MTATLEQKVDKIQETVDTHGQMLATLVPKVNLLEEKFDKLEKKVDNLAETVDKLVVVVLDIQTDQDVMKTDIGEMKEQNNFLINRIDHFLHIVDRHETEIAASSSAYHRLDDRVTVLETAKT